MSSNKIDIYWSPAYNPNNPEMSWELLYQNPVSLWDDIKEKRNLESKVDSFYMCPAASKKMRNTFVWKSPISMEYKFNKYGIVEPISDQFINVYQLKRMRSHSIKNSINFILDYWLIFFSEQKVKLFVTPPYFHKPGYLQYGATAFGEFDISSWYRPINFEVMTWSEEGTFKIEKDEPLFYAHFDSDLDINLIRYKNTPLLKKYENECAYAPSHFGLWKPLSERYKMFRSSGLGKNIIKEIKQNLV